MYNSCNQRVNSIYTLTTSEETMDQCYHISASTEEYHKYKKIKIKKQINSRPKHKYRLHHGFCK